MPAYIDWTGHGGGAVAPPAVFTGVLSCAFSFKIKRSSTQALVDKLLTPGGGGKVGYRLIGSDAIVSFMNVDRCGSVGQTSWTKGRECAIWLPLLEIRGGLPWRLVLWAPYVFIDYSLGLIAGREVWGWPKSIGRITLSGDPVATDYVCSTMIFRDTDNGSEGLEEPLLTIIGAPPPRVAVGGLGKAGAVAALTEALGFDLDIAGFAFPPDLPVVTLKQFPDSEHPDQACYQAIVNSPCRLTQFYGGGGLAGGELQIANCGSYRIAEALLGEPPKTTGYTAVPIAWGGWFNFDFQALPGSVVAP